MYVYMYVYIISLSLAVDHRFTGYTSGYVVSSYVVLEYSMFVKKYTEK